MMILSKIVCLVLGFFISLVVSVAIGYVWLYIIPGAFIFLLVREWRKL